MPKISEAMYFLPADAQPTGKLGRADARLDHRIEQQNFGRRRWRHFAEHLVTPRRFGKRFGNVPKE